VTLLCECMLVSRSRYYEWKLKPNGEKTKRQQEQERIKLIFDQSRGTYGHRRIQKALAKEGIRCNHKRIIRLMKIMNLTPKVKRKFKATTNSKHNLPVVHNLLARNFNPPRPNIAWVGDITYIWTNEGWLYLSTVIDLCSRKVKGWALNERMDAQLCVSALEMALLNTKSTKELMFHSDRGVQYASYAFRGQLLSHSITQSMSRLQNCWDNAVAESFFGTLKQELIYHCKFNTREEAKLAIFEYIEVFYNKVRLHSTLNYNSPEDIERLLAA